MTPKRFKSLEKEHEAIELELARQEGRQSEAETKVEKLTDNIAQLELDLDRQLVASETTKATATRKKITKLKGDLEAVKALLRGLENEIPRLRDRQKELQVARDEAFANLAGAWLKKEIAAYDRAAGALQERIKRLLCLHGELRERGFGQAYVTAVGPGYATLPGIKVPCLKNFSPAEFNRSGRYHSGDEFKKQILKEILGGKKS